MCICIFIPSTDHKPKNGEEMAMSRVGKELYEMLFKHYTKKQVSEYMNT